MTGIAIKPIALNSRDVNAFVKLPWKIYQNDPNWVPPLLMDVKKKLNPRKDPYHLHSETQLFLAYRDNQLVGRISASIDQNYIDFHEEKIGFFGFFECVADYPVAEALFDAAKAWMSARGMTAWRGPANFTSNHEWGLLVDGFDSPPSILMTYNPAYYIDFCERYGFQKAKDLFAFYLSTDIELNPRIISIADRIRDKHNIVMRQADMTNFDREIQTMKELYESTWKDNWGFVPMCEEEYVQMSKDMRQVIKPEFLLFAEVEGEPVGFSLTIPNLNRVLHKINGRLFPFGIFKLLYYMNKVDDLRLLLLGIKEGYRKRGIDSLFYVETFRRAKELGYKGGEISWTLEDNVLVNRAIESMGGQQYKTYRIYEMGL